MIKQIFVGIAVAVLSAAILTWIGLRERPLQVNNSLKVPINNTPILSETPSTSTSPEVPINNTPVLPETPSTSPTFSPSPLGLDSSTTVVENFRFELQGCKRILQSIKCDFLVTSAEKTYLTLKSYGAIIVSSEGNKYYAKRYFLAGEDSTKNFQVQLFNISLVN